MRKIYLDTIELNEATSVFIKDAEIILIGTTINSMSANDRNDKYHGKII